MHSLVMDFEIFVVVEFVYFDNKFVGLFFMNYPNFTDKTTLVDA